jgi:hypothetical protein
MENALSFAHESKTIGRPDRACAWQRLEWTATEGAMKSRLCRTIVGAAAALISVAWLSFGIDFGTPRRRPRADSVRQVFDSTEIRRLAALSRDKARWLIRLDSAGQQEGSVDVGRNNVQFEQLILSLAEGCTSSDEPIAAADFEIGFMAGKRGVSIRVKCAPNFVIYEIAGGTYRGGQPKEFRELADSLLAMADPPVD